mgnify:CR=1 FL=1
MVKVHFSSHFNRYLNCEPLTVEAANLLTALDLTFAQYPKLESYVLDDQRRLRKHVNIFVDGEMWSARNQLDQPISNQAEVYLMQALSGG